MGNAKEFWHWAGTKNPKRQARFSRRIDYQRQVSGRGADALVTDLLSTRSTRVNSERGPDSYFAELISAGVRSL